MMIWTDQQLAKVLTTAREIERAAREAIRTEDVVERDNALITARHVIALRKSLEGWIATRAIRAQLAVRTSVEA